MNTNAGSSPWIKKAFFSIHPLLLLVFLSLTGCSTPTVRICFTGDVLLDRGVRTQIERNGIDSILSGAKSIFEKADFTVVNLECPAVDDSTPVNKKYIFRADPEWLSNLKAAGVTHCNLANNHSYDQGREALTETYRNLISTGLVPLGYGENHALSCQPVVIEKDGIECAIFTSVTLPLENWMFLPEQPSLCQAGAEELAESIRNYKNSHPKSFIVVFLHWGDEFHQFPHSGQMAEAETLVASGADLIVGHHPHVVQSIQYIDGKPVFYSLGNFVFDQSKPLQNMALALIAEFSEGSEPVIRIYPVKINRCAPSVMPPGDSEQFLQEVEKISFDVKLTPEDDFWVPGSK